MSKKIQNKNKYNKPDMPKDQVKKTPVWFYIVPILLPVLFFVVLELLLRLFNYGTDYQQWLNLTDTVRIMNPDYTRKYFHTTAAVPYPNGNFFDINKADNAYRVFILGESSAAGYPFSPNGDFGKYIKKRLELDYPDRKIEVVNLGITAINTFTIRDLVPAILEQKPDLILIYTGHNEYYGALGVGSTESLGSGRKLVNAALWLEQFRTTQLVRNLIKSVAGLFSSAPQAKSGTLMSRMAKDQYIALNSDVYQHGLDQFQGNMSDILDMCKDKGVKVILGNLTSNIKDQYPFISVKSGNLPEASIIYKEAESLLKTDSVKAAKLLRYAKDLDALRFRASEKLNSIISDLARTYNLPLVNADSVFSANSSYNATGNELMTDHLHPTLGGYQLLGKAFYDVMTKSSVLPSGRNSSLSDEEKDKFVKAHYSFTALDSTMARYRIIILKNDWPYKTSYVSTEELLAQMQPKNRLDTLALEVTQKSMDWERAHRIIASIYLNNGDYRKYTEEMLVLIDQYPIISSYYECAQTLLGKQEYDLALEVLYKKEKYLPDAFSSKWIGNIALNRNNLTEAVKYLSRSVVYNNQDAQVYYNLAGAYAMQKQFSPALEAVNNCLRINPNFPGAVNLKSQLTSIKK